jgi:hypothetical protein
MLPFGVTIPATVPQGLEIPERLMDNPVYKYPASNIVIKFLQNAMPINICDMQPA